MFNELVYFLKNQYVKLIDILPIRYATWDKGGLYNCPFINHIINISPKQGLKACQKNGKYISSILYPTKAQVWSAISHKRAEIIDHISERNQSSDIHRYCLKKGISPYRLKGLKKETLIKAYKQFSRSKKAYFLKKPPILLQSYLLKINKDIINQMTLTLLYEARLLPYGLLCNKFDNYSLSILDPELTFSQLSMIEHNATKNISKYIKHYNITQKNLNNLLILIKSHPNRVNTASEILKEMQSYILTESNHLGNI